MPVVRSVRAALYGGTPCPAAVRCQPRQQALRPADCAERKHMQVKCRDWEAAGTRQQATAPATEYCASVGIGTSAGWEELTVLKKVLTLRTR